jgi:hypothetical protein
LPPSRYSLTQSKLRTSAGQFHKAAEEFKQPPRSFMRCGDHEKVSLIASKLTLCVGDRADNDWTFNNEGGAASRASCSRSSVRRFAASRRSRSAWKRAGAQKRSGAALKANRWPLSPSPMR